LESTSLAATEAVSTKKKIPTRKRPARAAGTSAMSRRKASETSRMPRRLVRGTVE
jgi:hypothetical protein